VRTFPSSMIGLVISINFDRHRYFYPAFCSNLKLSYTDRWQKEHKPDRWKMPFEVECIVLSVINEVHVIDRLLVLCALLTRQYRFHIYFTVPQYIFITFLHVLCIIPCHIIWWSVIVSCLRSRFMLTGLSDLLNTSDNERPFYSTGSLLTSPVPFCFGLLLCICIYVRTKTDLPNPLNMLPFFNLYLLLHVYRRVLFIVCNW
jgi:hypothetical protein